MLRAVGRRRVRELVGRVPRVVLVRWAVAPRLVVAGCARLWQCGPCSCGFCGSRAESLCGSSIVLRIAVYAGDGRLELPG